MSKKFRRTEIFTNISASTGLVELFCWLVYIGISSQWASKYNIDFTVQTYTFIAGIVSYLCVNMVYIVYFNLKVAKDPIF